MDEVIDDLISLESGFNDGGLDCMESNLLMQNNVSMKHCYSSTVLKCHTLCSEGLLYGFLGFMSTLMSSWTTSEFETWGSSNQTFSLGKSGTSQFEDGLSLEMSESSLGLATFLTLLEKFNNKDSI